MAPIFKQTVDELATLLEEGARASKRAVGKFVEPMAGTLRRAQSKRHHIVFGRRGSGKSSLLYKTAAELSEKKVPVAFVDLEPFKGHQYPDILISVLLATMLKLEQWLSLWEAKGTNRTWWKFWKKTDKKALKEELLRRLRANISDLRKQLLLEDAAKLTQTAEQGVLKGEKAKVGAKTKVPLTGSDVEAEIARDLQVSTKTSMSEESKRSKIDYLHRKILDYQELFASLAELTGGDCYLFLDDLYHIIRADQPRLLDYFHRITKGNHCWLKVGTIKHRSTWYVNSPQPVGLKTADDADDIDLDLTLENFSIAQKFLGQIFEVYIELAKAPPRDDLISNGGMERLVMASGGVPRDFLALARKSIDEARERLTRDPQHPRGIKIGAEDVNMASGAYGGSKKEEFQTDSLGDETALQEAFDKIRRFCLEQNRANVFLIEQDVSAPAYDRVQELIDLRLVHHVKSRVTVSDRPGKAYRALLLDFSQYTGARRQSSIEIVEFWKGDRQTLRKAKLIYDPSVTPEALEQQIQATNNRLKADAQKGDQPQQELGLPGL